MPLYLKSEHQSASGQAFSMPERKDIINLQYLALLIETKNGLRLEHSAVIIGFTGQQEPQTGPSTAPSTKARPFPQGP